MMWIQSPNEMRHHPLFWFEARRVRWAGRIWPYARRILLLAHLVIFASWLILLLLVLALRGSVHDLITGSANFLNILALAVIVAGGGLLDYVALQASAQSFNGEITQRRWDLIKLTALNDWGIIRAKHAGVRLRVWRMTVMVAGVRIATISLGAVLALVLPFLFEGRNGLLDNLLDAVVTDPLSLLFVLLTTVVTLLVYVLEVFWRMQAMSALGLYLSARILNTPLVFLAGFAAILVVWMAQALIVAALVFGLGFVMGGFVSSFYIYYGDNFWLYYLYLFLCCLVTAVTVYGFYNLLQSWSLRRLYHRIGQAD